MFKYWWIVLAAALFCLGGCSWERITKKQEIYQIQGISARIGQSVDSLYDDNGAPNTIQRLSNNRVMWIYYTNYRPVGGGELISYDMPPQAKTGTTCAVKIILQNDVVQRVMSNCS